VNRKTLIPLLLVAGFVTGCGGSKTADVGPSSTGRVAAGPADVCESDPLAGVHDPDRLTVLTKCATFVGTVVRAPKLNPSDGDVTFNATPDPGSASMLNAQNRAEGGLHLEIVPRDQPGCPPGQPAKGSEDNLGKCSGRDVVFPPLGAHIRVTGTWVLDTWNNWNEIHPVWKVEILPPGGKVPPERHVFKALLTGVANDGSKRAAGVATVTTNGTKLCWSIAVRAGAGKPTKAVIRKTGAPPTTLPLGARYRPKGCVTASEQAAEALFEEPETHTVTVYTPRYKQGSARGSLRHASD
jgi:hypothetical protein